MRGRGSGDGQKQSRTRGLALRRHWNKWPSPVRCLPGIPWGIGKAREAELVSYMVHIHHPLYTLNPAWHFAVMSRAHSVLSWLMTPACPAFAGL